MGGMTGLQSLGAPSILAFFAGMGGMHTDRINVFLCDAHHEWSASELLTGPQSLGAPSILAFFAGMGGMHTAGTSVFRSDAYR